MQTLAPGRLDTCNARVAVSYRHLPAAPGHMAYLLALPTRCVPCAGPLPMCCPSPHVLPQTRAMTRNQRTTTATSRRTTMTSDVACVDGAHKCCLASKCMREERGSLRMWLNTTPNARSVKCLRQERGEGVDLTSGVSGSACIGYRLCNGQLLPPSLVRYTVWLGLRRTAYGSVKPWCIACPELLLAQKPQKPLRSLNQIRGKTRTVR